MRVGEWKSKQKAVTLSLKLIKRAEDMSREHPDQKAEDQFIVNIEFVDISDIDT